MRIQSTNFLIGVFLVLIGGLFLAGSLGHLRISEEHVAAILFAAAGIVFILAHFLFNNKLWTLILGAVGLFIGSAIAIEETRALPSEYSGFIFFILIAFVFLYALRKGKKNWWAIIPGGMSLVFAAHVLLEINWWIKDQYHGVLFFGGVGLIFGIIYFMKDENYKLDWAKYPSIIAFSIAGLVMLSLDFSDIFSRFAFPAILIGIGSFILWKSLKKPDAVETRESD